MLIELRTEAPLADTHAKERGDDVVLDIPDFYCVQKGGGNNCSGVRGVRLAMGCQDPHNASGFTEISQIANTVSLNVRILNDRLRNSRRMT